MGKPEPLGFAGWACVAVVATVVIAAVFGPAILFIAAL
jgi:hypothetical protein